MPVYNSALAYTLWHINTIYTWIIDYAYTPLYVHSVNISAGGKQALLQLSGGDMRRVLNLLQATHLSYELVDEEVVYLTAG